MRKIVPFLVMSILVLSGLGAVAFPQDNTEAEQNEIVLFSKPVITENQDFVTIGLPESTAYIMETGKPMLPKYSKTYTFPFGTTIENVEVTFSEPIQQKVSKLVTPAPEPQIVSTVHMSKKITKEEVMKSYSEIKTYPEKKYSYRTGAGLQDGGHVVFLTINLNPIQYVPSENMIYYSNSAKITVNYNLPIAPITFGDDYDMLIIAPSEFSSALQPLIDYKNEHDTKTILTTLEEIPDVGADKQESIKYYVKDSIENLGITYLLLVGSSEKFPTRYAQIPSGQYDADGFPSDLYYADIYDANMGFSSWDADGDGKYCEVTGASNDISEIDMYPDVYLGKLPAASVSELSSFVEKLLNYEEHNKMMKTIAQVGGDTFVGDPEDINEGEFCNAAVLQNLPGYSTTRLWASTGTLTKQNIADAFNAGVDFVDFSGHGSPQSWATHPPDDDEIWIPKPDVRDMLYSGFLYTTFDTHMIQNKDKLPVVVYNACSTSKYTESYSSSLYYPCLSWKTVMKSGGGGIACFGASGIGYGTYGTDETKRLWGWMEVNIFKEIYNNKDLGKSWANCLNGYINSFIDDEEDEWNDADYKTITEMSLFGDPSLAIEDGPDPKSRSVSSEPIHTSLLEKLINQFPILEKLLSLVLKLN